MIKELCWRTPPNCPPNPKQEASFESNPTIIMLPIIITTTASSCINSAFYCPVIASPIEELASKISTSKLYKNVRTFSPVNWFSGFGLSFSSNYKTSILQQSQINIFYDATQIYFENIKLLAKRNNFIINVD